MWPFRRKAGKHELGAAVTAIPSAPRPVPPSYDAPVAVPVEPAPAVLEVPTPSLPAPAAPEPSVQAPEVPAQPRVELGFRDGSTAALAPGSEQAKALTEIASVLTQRD